MKLKKYIIEKKAEMTGEQHKDHFLKQLNKWDTDLSKMTKAYKSLKADESDLKRFIMLKKAFIVFSKNFEKWIYRNILKNKKSKDESYFQTEVRTTAWSFIIRGISDYDLFPETYDYKNEKHIPAPWELDSGFKKNNRKTNITRYQGLWRKFKEAFIGLIEYEANKIDEIKSDEIVNVGKINIIIKNRTKEWGDKYIKKFIKHVKNVTSVIKKEGLDKSIRDLAIELNFDPSDISGLPSGLTAGAYDRNSDKLYILPLGISDKLSSSTLIHEIGHRYWFKHVPSKAKKAWEEKINSQMIAIKKEHIDKFFDKYWDNDRFGDNIGSFMPSDKIIKDLKNIIDPTLKIVFDYLSDNRPWFNVEVDKERYEKYKDYMVKHHKGEQIPLEWITDYGRTNPSEAFAETFRIWVSGNKGKLGPWTRAFFKEIVATGGVNIKEEKNNLIYKYI